MFAADDVHPLRPQRIDAHVLAGGADIAAELLRWWQSSVPMAPTAAVVAGSNPDIRDVLLANWPIPGCLPLLIAHSDQIGISVDVEFPERVGIDRLLNGLAACRLTAPCPSPGTGLAGAPGQPMIIVDSGTATTVDLVTSDGVFRGGSILPGLRLAAHAMHDYTARLPLLDVDEDLTSLPELPGRNTEAAMLAGLFIGQLGAVREISLRLADAAKIRFQESRDARLIVTGGGGRQLVSYLNNAVYIDSLPLHGLALLGMQQLQSGG